LPKSTLGFKLPCTKVDICPGNDVYHYEVADLALNIKTSVTIPTIT